MHVYMHSHSCTHPHTHAHLNFSNIGILNWWFNPCGTFLINWLINYHGIIIIKLQGIFKYGVFAEFIFLTCEKFKLPDEVRYLAVELFDRYVYYVIGF